MLNSPDMYKLPTAELALRDSQSHLWCGSAEAVLKAPWMRYYALEAEAGMFGWFVRDELAQPRLKRFADAAVICLTGLVTWSAWERFAEVVNEAERAFSIRLLTVVINSRAQQAAGFEAAAAALAAAGEVLTTHAHLVSAGGLAMPLAQVCHLVTAQPAAPIGFMAMHWPLVDPIWTGRLLPCEGGRGRGFDDALNRRLQFGSVPAEQCESRGVDRLHRSWMDAQLDAYARMNGGQCDVG